MGWPAVFLVNLPIGVVLLLVGLRGLEESRNPGAPAIDIPGTALSVLGVGALAYGLIESGARGWTAPAILGSFTAAAILLAAFIAVEARRSAPMLPVRLFRQRLFTVSNTAMVVVGFALMGSSFFFSQFFVDVQGSSILRAGLQTLPTTLAMVIVSPLAGRLAARYGLPTVVTAGLVLAGGLASGISSTTRQIGAVLGVAVLGAVVRTRQSGGASFETGLDGAFLTAGAVTLASAALTGLWLTRSQPGPERAEKPWQPSERAPEPSISGTAFLDDGAPSQRQALGSARGRHSYRA